jgi:Holliday junction resolvase RusA-like endonuclease
MLETMRCNAMTEYNIRVVGTPVAQPRPKIRIMRKAYALCAGLLSGGAKAAYANIYKCVTGHAYVPEDHAVHHWRATVQQAVRAVVWDKITEPVAVRCVFLMPRPQAMIWATKPMPRVFYAAKTNDGDNLLKAVFDACNDAKIWDDDGQVVEGSFGRRYAAGDEKPGVEISIRIVAPEEAIAGVNPWAARDKQQSLFG